MGGSYQKRNRRDKLAKRRGMTGGGGGGAFSSMSQLSSLLAALNTIRQLSAAKKFIQAAENSGLDVQVNTDKASQSVSIEATRASIESIPTIEEIHDE